MQSSLASPSPCSASNVYSTRAESRPLYQQLLTPAAPGGQPSAETLEAARAYLQARLEEASALPMDAADELPETLAAVPAWMEANLTRVGQQYQQYLAARKAGAAPRYFSSKAHALYFLRAVAPTKLVDGAWLYGLLAHWQDPRFAGLIRTYLEELGEGRPEQNHVRLYRQLLAANGCEDADDLDDPYYVQGAIQLALAYQAEHFLPELIGFNLGYEQLPLHLMICAYELSELAIDPYYFTLHVTVDNAASGHARLALDGLLQALPQLGDRHGFYRRVRNGYRLNALGVSTLAAIEGFDLEAQVHGVLARKSRIGKQMHGDFCRFGERTVNQWLADPAEIPAFLQQLQAQGWIKRHRDPAESRFWQLIQGPKAAMFGVFSGYEQALIKQWIAGDWSPVCAPRRRVPARGGATGPTAIDPKAPASDFDSEERLLEQRLAGLADPRARMTALIPLLAPHRHDRPVGLLATRLFVQGLARS
ncbi:MAG: iron-containing redox enzyme family protein [Pseudomonas sp.]|uniref:iron-containing redox enzyme family protein n=1 Tax=Pseudomonas sp. TaxID=306 RepID=UPI0033943694